MKFSQTFGLSLALCVGAAGTASAEGLTPRDIYKKFGRGVVLVFATDGSAQGSAGTGSIITSDGQIITNNHVISHDGQRYKKVFIYLKPDKISGSMSEDLKKRYEAQIVDTDEKLDLALLKMKAPPEDLQTISFVDPEDVEIGDPVIAIGHPETGGLWTLTTGTISSMVKDFSGIDGKHVFQTEASINRGNSGGPLLNVFGQMVGINTCISRRAADGLAITSINFSLKSSVPVDWLKRKDLLALKMEKPGQGSDMVAVAANDAKAPEAGAGKAPKPKETITVEGEGGKKVAVAVIEPKKGEQVADDPSFGQPKATSNVTSDRAIDNGKPAKGKPPAPPAEPESKQLTPRRPYKMEPFVADRNKEIKALEEDMDDARRIIEERSKGMKKGGAKKPSGADNGMGLW